MKKLSFNAKVKIGVLVSEEGLTYNADGFFFLIGGYNFAVGKYQDTFYNYTNSLNQCIDNPQSSGLTKPLNFIEDYIAFLTDGALSNTVEVSYLDGFYNELLESEKYFKYRFSQIILKAPFPIFEASESGNSRRLEIIKLDEDNKIKTRYVQIQSHIKTDSFLNNIYTFDFKETENLDSNTTLYFYFESIYGITSFIETLPIIDGNEPYVEFNLTIDLIP